MTTRVDRLAWHGVFALCFLAFVLVAALDVAEALREERPGIAALRGGFGVFWVAWLWIMSRPNRKAIS